MRGSRGRIGLLVPSVNIVVEPETNVMLPEGVTAHAARVSLESSEELAGVSDLVRNAENAILQLVPARVEVIGFACTTASFYAGVEGERRLRARLEEVGGVPVVTAIGAVVAALAGLGAHRVAMATPYSARVNALAQAFLEGNGIDVVSSVGLGIHDTADIGLVDEETVIRVAKRAARADADALFLSCTNLPTISLIAALEAETSLPVVSSNQALIWAMLRRIGVAVGTGQFGGLMAMESRGIQAAAEYPDAQ
jgi:maleate isomerase